jgi:hypothetical protein
MSSSSAARDEHTERCLLSHMDDVAERTLHAIATEETERGGGGREQDDGSSLTRMDGDYDAAADGTADDGAAWGGEVDGWTPTPSDRRYARSAAATPASYTGGYGPPGQQQQQQPPPQQQQRWQQQQQQQQQQRWQQQQQQQQRWQQQQQQQQQPETSLTHGVSGFGRRWASQQVWIHPDPMSYVESYRQRLRLLADKSAEGRGGSREWTLSQ